MCKAIEEMRDKFLEIGEKRGEKRGRKEEREETALALLEEGSFGLEKIAKMTRLSLDEVKKLQSSHPA